MDSALLDQVRHLCRDRAAYERLKAILVQQERVHQLSWEDRHEKLISTNSSDPDSLDSKASDIFKNIIAREKALAQLADAMQRSPSLELILQVAVQVAQKLLQVDRVAIFRAHPDGRGEFAIDAIAAGVTSLADMPERQLSLARHMIEFTEHSAQIIDSRSSSLSSHIVTLLEHIGSSSYVANKIYAEQEVWGTLVAFEGSSYHNWLESDHTSISLIAAQIGIAISLNDLRQQSQELTDDLQILQIELDNLQQTVVEIAENITVNPDIALDITENITEPITQNMVEDGQIDDFISNDLETNDPETDDPETDNPETDDPEISQVDQDQEESKIFSNEEIVVSTPIPISQNGLPAFFVVPDFSLPSSENIDLTENISSVGSETNFKELSSIPVIVNDDLKVASFSDFEQEDFEQEDFEQEEFEQEDFAVTEEDTALSEAYNLELNKIELAELEKAELERIQAELAELERVEAENFTSDIIENLALEEDEQEAIASDLDESDQDENTSVEVEEPEIIASELVRAELIKLEMFESKFEQTDRSHNNLATLVDEDEEPIIEPEFIETILGIAGNDSQATDFLLNVIDSYLEDAPRLVQAIDKAIAANDHLRLLQSLNTLRSSSHYIGALKLSHQCRQLESAIKANYVVLIYACLSQVAIEVPRVTDALRIERSRHSQNSDRRSPK